MGLMRPQLCEALAVPAGPGRALAAAPEAPLLGWLIIITLQCLA